VLHWRVPAAELEEAFDAACAGADKAVMCSGSSTYSGRRLGLSLRVETDSASNVSVCVAVAVYQAKSAVAHSATQISILPPGGISRVWIERSTWFVGAQGQAHRTKLEAVECFGTFKDALDRVGLTLHADGSLHLRLTAQVLKWSVLQCGAYV
jgi:hypothetical protein